MVAMKASRLILLTVVLLALAGSALTALLVSGDNSPELGETVRIRTVGGPAPGRTPAPRPSTTSATPEPPTSTASSTRRPSPSKTATSGPAPDRTHASDRPQATRVTGTPPQAGVDDDDDHGWDDADDDRDDGLDD
jgi:hypothetical protein